MHKAFWDMLKEELSDDPPKYQFAIKLLEEIREVSTHLMAFTLEDNSLISFITFSFSKLFTI